MIKLPYGLRPALQGNSGRGPRAAKLLISSEPTNKAAGVANSISAYAASVNDVAVPGWSGDGTLTVTAGTPSVRTVADFASASKERLRRSGDTFITFPDGEFTIALFVDFAATGSSDWLVAHFGSGASFQEYAVYKNSSDIMSFSGRSSGGQNTVTASTFGAVSAGTLYFIAARYSKSTAGGRMQISVNGGDWDTLDGVGTLFSGSGTIATVFGCYGDQNANFHNGKLANVFFSPSIVNDTILADLRNGGVIPFATELDTATIAASKFSGGTDGDLLFMLDEASGDRASFSGNYTFEDFNTVASASSGESITYADVAIESGDTATASSGVLTFAPVIGRPGTGYKVTVADDATELSSAQSDAFDVYEAGLIDGVSATVNAAYSMYAKLIGPYKGALFEVTRASDSATQDIGPYSGSKYADMAALLSFLSGTTGTVTKLYDQSGNGYTMTAVNAPAFAASGMNSLPSMDCDVASSHYLSRTSGAPTDWPFGAYVTCNVDGSGSRCYWSTGKDSNDHVLAGHNASTHLSHITVDGVASNNQGSTDWNGQGIVGESLFLASNSVVRSVNGTDTSSGSTELTNFLEITKTLIGARASTSIDRFWDGDIGEIVELSSAPSTADRNLIGGALAALRGVTWNTIL